MSASDAVKKTSVLLLSKERKGSVNAKVDRNGRTVVATFCDIKWGAVNSYEKLAVT